MQEADEKNDNANAQLALLVKLRAELGETKSQASLQLGLSKGKG